MVISRLLSMFTLSVLAISCRSREPNGGLSSSSYIHPQDPTDAWVLSQDLTNLDLTALSYASQLVSAQRQRNLEAKEQGTNLSGNPPPQTPADKDVKNILDQLAEAERIRAENSAKLEAARKEREEKLAKSEALKKLYATRDSEFAAYRQQSDAIDAKKMKSLEITRTLLEKAKNLESNSYDAEKLRLEIETQRTTVIALQKERDDLQKKYQEKMRQLSQEIIKNLPHEWEEITCKVNVKVSFTRGFTRRYAVYHLEQPRSFESSILFNINSDLANPTGAKEPLWMTALTFKDSEDPACLFTNGTAITGSEAKPSVKKSCSTDRNHDWVSLTMMRMKPMPEIDRSTEIQRSSLFVKGTKDLLDLQAATTHTTNRLTSNIVSVDQMAKDHCMNSTSSWTKKAQQHLSAYQDDNQYATISGVSYMPKGCDCSYKFKGTEHAHRVSL